MDISFILDINRYNMKRTINIAIGERKFTIDEDAYTSLSSYLESYKAGVSPAGKAEVMDELEMRIADLFEEKLKGREVVNAEIVREIIDQLGMPDWQSDSATGASSEPVQQNCNISKRFYRDMESNMIGGICSGLSLYLNIDIILVRVIFTVALFCGSVGFWVYVVLWLIAPAARTAYQKCELRGIPPTAENIRMFSNQRK